MTLRHGTARYGYDAPAVMFGLLAAGIFGLAVGSAASAFTGGWLHILGLAFSILAAVPLLLGMSMVAYGLVGKHRVREHMLGLIDWRGGERVLDIGTGGGLHLIGAAKRLGRGVQATGIDIWRAEDLTDNALGRLPETSLLRVSKIGWN